MSTIDDVRKARLKLAFETLAAAGITHVKIAFDGCGDSGQIEEVTGYYNGEHEVPLPDHDITWVHGAHTWGPIPTPGASTGPVIVGDTPGALPQGWEEKWSFDPKTGKLNDLLEDIVYDYMEQEHSGWENNDGSFGEFVFDVADKSVNYEHNTRFTDSRLDTYEYRLEE